MIEPKDKEDLNRRIKACRTILDMIENFGGGIEEEGEKGEDKKQKDGEKCDDCNSIHDEEGKQTLKKVHEVLYGRGGMLSIVTASEKERESGGANGLFMVRRMNRSDITIGMINLFQQVFDAITTDLSDQKKNELKRIVLEALEENT